MKIKLILFIITCLALFLGIFVSFNEPFLNTWDEQFHALVAKNLSINPFKPILINDPILGYDYKNWTYNHIWLHKQPFFLWIMALSLKIFGYSEFAVRFPSIIMHAIYPLLIFKISILTLKNVKIALIASLLSGIAFFPLELVCGRYSTDHNDLVFLFLMTGSYWTWLEFQNTKNIKWLLYIGIFSGLAIMTKWLMGSLVYITWIVVLLSENKGTLRSKLIEFKLMLYSVFVCCIIFIPWQIYSYLHFQKEYLHELKLNASHLYKPIENHHEELFFHLKFALHSIYSNNFIFVIVLIFGLYFFIKSIATFQNKLFILFITIFVYVFYTIAQTKMVSFTVIVFPFFIMFISLAISKLFDWIEKFKLNRRIKNSLYTSIIILSVIFFLKYSNYSSNHSNDYVSKNENRLKDLKEMHFISDLKRKFKDERVIIFNANLSIAGHIPILFYTSYNAHTIVPTERQIDYCIKKKYKVAVLKIGALPEHLLNNSNIQLIDCKKYMVKF